MKGAWRLAIAALPVGLVPLPGVALAQTAPPPPVSNSAAPDAIGPSELQNFSLRGTVTRPADQPPPSAQATPPAPARTVASRAPAEQARAVPPPAQSTRTVPAQSPVAVRSAPASQSPETDLAAQPIAPSSLPPSTAIAAPPADPRPSPRGLLVWPWIAAALAFGAGAAWLWRRRQTRAAAAAGPQIDLFVPPEPAAPPPPNPPPQRLTTIPARTTQRRKPATGIVASRLRPALEIGFQPLSCQVDDDQVRLEFELELFNSGAAPARAVLAEASLLNAGATQEHDLAAFFAHPQGAGERLSVIAPLQRVSFRSQVAAPRSAVQEYELAGRKAFVPVIAFNALYEWSGGNGQSSAAYLVGRDTNQEKLGPLRLDQGAREFRGLAARTLPSALRT